VFCETENYGEMLLQNALQMINECEKKSFSYEKMFKKQNAVVLEKQLSKINNIENSREFYTYIDFSESDDIKHKGDKITFNFNEQTIIGEFTEEFQPGNAVLAKTIIKNYINQSITESETETFLVGTLHMIFTRTAFSKILITPNNSENDFFRNFDKLAIDAYLDGKILPQNIFTINKENYNFTLETSDNSIIEGNLTLSFTQKLCDTISSNYKLYFPVIKSVRDDKKPPLFIMKDGNTIELSDTFYPFGNPLVNSGEFYINAGAMFFYSKNVATVTIEAKNKVVDYTPETLYGIRFSENFNTNNLPEVTITAVAEYYDGEKFTRLDIGEIKSFVFAPPSDKNSESYKPTDKYKVTISIQLPADENECSVFGAKGHFIKIRSITESCDSIFRREYVPIISTITLTMPSNSIVPDYMYNDCNVSENDKIFLPVITKDLTLLTIERQNPLNCRYMTVTNGMASDMTLDNNSGDITVNIDGLRPPVLFCNITRIKIFDKLETDIFDYIPELSGTVIQPPFVSIPHIDIYELYEVISFSVRKYHLISAPDVEYLIQCAFDDNISVRFQIDKKSEAIKLLVTLDKKLFYHSYKNIFEDLLPALNNFVNTYIDKNISLFDNEHERKIEIIFDNCSEITPADKLYPNLSLKLNCIAAEELAASAIENFSQNADDFNIRIASPTATVLDAAAYLSANLSELAEESFFYDEVDLPVKMQTIQDVLPDVYSIRWNINGFFNEFDEKIAASKISINNFYRELSPLTANMKYLPLLAKYRGGDITLLPKEVPENSIRKVTEKLEYYISGAGNIEKIADIFVDLTDCVTKYLLIFPTASFYIESHENNFNYFQNVGTQRFLSSFFPIEKTTVKIDSYSGNAYIGEDYCMTNTVKNAVIMGTLNFVCEFDILDEN
jgi:hypothetical protein